MQYRGGYMKFCKQCELTGRNVVYAANKKMAEYTKGFIVGWSDDIDKCPFCDGKLENTPITNDDFFVRKNDVIEYELKMGQFRTMAKQQEAIRVAEKKENSKPKCPRCGSTAITTGQRGYNVISGFFGSNKTVNRCGNCGYKWEPKK